MQFCKNKITFFLFKNQKSQPRRQAKTASNTIRMATIVKICPRHADCLCHSSPPSLSHALVYSRNSLLPFTTTRRIRTGPLPPKALTQAVLLSPTQPSSIQNSQAFGANLKWLRPTCAVVLLSLIRNNRLELRLYVCNNGILIDTF